MTSAVSAQGASIQETKIDPRTTEYLIKGKILGWYISDGENISSQSDSSCDFTMEKTNGTITYQESGKKAIIVATIISQTEAIHQTMPITPTELTFPTAWSCDTSSQQVTVANLSLNTVVGALLLIFPFGASVAQFIAQTIIGIGSLVIEYSIAYWSRLLSLLEQERYKVYTFYSDPNHTTQFYQYTTPHETIYLG